MSNEYRVYYGMSAVRPVGVVSYRTVAPPPETFASKAARFAINAAIALMTAVTVIVCCVLSSLVMPIQLSVLVGYALGAIGALAFLELKR